MNFLSLLGKHRQAGFTLTEVIVGGAVLAGVGLMSAKLYRDQRMAQARISADQAIDSAHQMIQKTLSHAPNCNTTLKQRIAQNSAITGTVASPLTFTSIFKCTNCLDTSNVNFDAYHAMFTGTAEYTVNASPFKLSNTGTASLNAATQGSSGWTIVSMGIIDSRTTTGTVRFRITYGITDASGRQRTVAKDISLGLRFVGGFFRECYDAAKSITNNTQNDMCKTFNLDETDGSVSVDGRVAVWDPIEQRCVVSGGKSCGPGEQISGIGSDGVIRCRSVISSSQNATDLSNSTVVNCTPGQKPTPVYDTVTKKMRVVCNP